MRRMTKQQKAAVELLEAAKVQLKNPYRGAVQRAIDLIEGVEDAALTSLHYDRLTPGNELTDPRHAGLVMKYGKRTGKRWFYRTAKPFSTTRVDILIGRYPDVSIAQARQIREQMAQVRAQGVMPQPFAAQAHQEARTVSDLFDWYLAEYCKTKRPSSVETDARVIELHLRPAFGGIPIADWSAEQIEAHLHVLFNQTAKGRQAEKCRAILSAMNNAARGKSRRFAGRVEWLRGIPDPMQDVAQLPDRGRIEGKARENYKPPITEMQRLVGNLGALPALASDVVLLQVLTCARISEVTQLPWSELDLQAGVWTLPPARAKNSNEHLVMLPRQAVELLQARKDAAGGGAWVFPSPMHPAAPVSSETVMRQLAASRGALGVSDRFTSHAVRHACLTWCAENGIGREVRDRISNHLPPSGVDREYNGATLNAPARDALQAWADVVTADVGKVVSLRG